MSELPLSTEIKDRLGFAAKLETAELRGKKSELQKLLYQAARAQIDGWRYLATGEGDPKRIIDSLDKQNRALITSRKVKFRGPLDMYVFCQLDSKSERRDIRAIIKRLLEDEGIVWPPSQLESEEKRLWREWKDLGR